MVHKDSFQKLKCSLTYLKIKNRQLQVNNKAKMLVSERMNNFSLVLTISKIEIFKN